MNRSRKILFWCLVVTLGFVNPLLSFAMIVLYYLPRIIKSICVERADGSASSEDERKKPSGFSEYSDETLEEMK